MEIKFWDKILKEYTDNDYYVNSLGEAVELYGGMDATLERCEYIEPHFYLNGERIA